MMLNVPKVPDARKCCVEYCPNTGRNCKLTFFTVPRDDSVKAKKWMTALKMKPNLKKKRFICSDHFEMNCFTDTFKRHLNSFAVPTLQFKVPNEEGTTWEKCMESHFVWNNMNSSSSFESSKSQQAQSSSEEMCVVASVFVPSESSESDFPRIDKPSTEQTVARFVSERNGIESSDNQDIEKEINDYLRRRYLNIENQKVLENALNSYFRRKKVTKNRERETSQNSITRMEDSCSSVEDHQSIDSPAENNSLGQLPLQEVRINAKLPTSFDSILKSNTQTPTIMEQSCGTQNFNSSPCYVRPVCDELNLTVTENQIPCTSQTISVESGALTLETDNDCDKFAASIAEELKQVKNLTCREKMARNIQRILLKAKSGIYDMEI